MSTEIPTPAAGPPEALIELAFSLALRQAERAVELQEVPVGAAIVDRTGRVLSEAHNEIELRRDPTAHAERLAVTAACHAVGHARLPEGSLIAVTLEPCAMCAGALVLARVGSLVFGALDPKAGACGSLRDVVRDPRLNHRIQVLPQRQEEVCGQLLTQFFRQLRREGCPPVGRSL
ncbi:MAG: nucleoside deaminase [Planctomycetota bacterium]